MLHLLKKRETALTPLLRALERVADALAVCSTCGNVDTTDPCSVCADPRRDVIRVDGDRLPTAADLVHLAVHKPRGMLSAMSDSRGRPCVGDLRM